MSWFAKGGKLLQTWDSHTYTHHLFWQSWHERWCYWKLWESQNEEKGPLGKDIAQWESITLAFNNFPSWWMRTAGWIWIFLSFNEICLEEQLYSVVKIYGSFVAHWRITKEVKFPGILKPQEKKKHLFLPHPWTFWGKGWIYVILTFLSSLNFCSW